VLASAGFVEGSETKRPSVQVGDPFEEKKLIEACLELLDAGLAIGVQDLGAAGLCCAASETAAKTGAGMDVDAARVSKREPGMNPVELLTSESQERMLAIVTPENLDEVLGLCERWEIRATVIGRVTDSARFRVFDGYFDAIGVPGTNPKPPIGDDAPVVSSDREPVADVPIGSLGDGPLYHRPLAPPADLAERQAEDPSSALFTRFPPGSDLSAELLDLLASPNIADKSWVWRQYDHQLFLNPVAGPGGDASVLRLKETNGRALSLSVDGKGRFCALDPREGIKLAVLEAGRNVACSGARPMALVNCLNFGNPEHPEVMWQFSEVIDGMAEACNALGMPVVGGNVSFYNESHGVDIDPTPVVGVIGLIDDLSSPLPGIGLRAGDRIVQLGETRAELGGSEWATRHNLRGGKPPSADLAKGKLLHELVAGLVTDRMVNSLHDCSDGGVAIALAEMAIAGEVGFRVAVGDARMCFSESASRVVLSVAPAQLNEVLGRASSAKVPAMVLGDAGGDELRSDGAFTVSLAAATSAWRDSIPSIMGAGIDVG
jgi:phosphoribosylformylglycinamidine synthase